MELQALFSEKRPIFQELGSPEVRTSLELWHDALKFRDAIEAASGGRRPTIAVMLRQDYGMVTALVGAHLAGAVIAPLYPALRPAELCDVFNLIRPTLAVTSRGDLPEVLEGLGASTNASKTASIWKIDYDDGQFVDVPGTADMILNSSGSTGRPKGILLSGATVLRNAHCFGSRLGLVPGARYYCPLPFAHSGGIVMGWWAAVTTGAHFLTSVEFNASESAHQLVELSPEFVGAVDTMFVRWAAEVPGRSLGRTAWSTGDEATLRKVQESCGFEHVVRPYGLTECSPNVGVGDPAIATGPPADARIWVHEGIEVRIDTEGGVNTELAGEVEGEILVTGWSLGLGYVTESGVIPLPLEGGWLRTGDLGYLDSVGALLFTGRLKEMLKVGGLNIWPQEIEEAFRVSRFPREVCVVGRADSEYGEVPVAVLDEAPSAEALAALRSSCAGLPRIKQPRAYYSLGHGFPVTPSGKLDRRRITALIDGGSAKEL